MAFSVITNAAVAAGAALTTALMTALRDNIDATYGGMPFLQKITLSGQASIDFDLIDASLYDGYLIRFNNVVPSDAIDLLLVTFSADGGSTYLTSYDYAFARLVNQSSIGELDGSNLPQISLGSTVNNVTSNGGLSGELVISSPHSASNKTHGTAHLIITDNTDTLYMVTGGFRVRSVSATDNIKFEFLNGTLASGSISIFGIRSAETG